MKVDKCKNKDNWNKNLEQNHSRFLQSWEWGEFKQSIGKDVYRLQVKKNDEVQAQTQGVKLNPAVGLSYLYFPRASASAFSEELLHEISNEVAFARVEPIGEFESLSDFKSVDTHHRQPQHTLVLDVNSELSDLLEEMHSKTRYNIRLAERKGVEVKQKKDLNIFCKLYRETEQRGDFSGHNEDYFKKMLQLDNVYQLIAYYEGQPLASNILMHSGDNITYLHGGSTREHRDVMATYRVQWRGIQLAKELACSYYDFWGSAPVYDEKKIDDMSGYDKSFGKCWPKDHDLSGVTRFKVRFNPDSVSYPQAKDIIFDPMRYRIYSAARKLRSLSSIK